MYVSCSFFANKVFLPDMFAFPSIEVIELIHWGESRFPIPLFDDMIKHLCRWNLDSQFPTYTELAHGMVLALPGLSNAVIELGPD